MSFLRAGMHVVHLSLASVPLVLKSDDTLATSTLTRKTTEATDKSFAKTQNVMGDSFIHTRAPLC
jgi:hypothetical protein